jgi:hypothetical protein
MREGEKRRNGTRYNDSYTLIWPWKHKKLPAA